MNKKTKVYIIVLIASILVTIISISYAYFAPSIGNSANTNINVTSKTTDKLSFTKGTDISLIANQQNFTEGGTNISSSTTSSAKLVANSNTNSANDTYNIYFSINTNDYVYTNGTTPELILIITDPTGNEVTSIEGLTYISTGVTGFDVTTKTGLITIAEDYAISTNSSTTGTTQNWTATITFINLTTNQQSNTSKKFESILELRKEKYITLVNKLASDVPSIYSNVYQVVSDNNGNYRYSGSYNSVNNWVCFGSTEATCPDNNLYRIIGIFNIDGAYKYKLIQGDFATTTELGTPYSTVSRNTSYPGHTSQTTINRYQWHTADGVSWGSGTTCTSSLCTLLNGTYLTNIGSTWSNLIATSTWYAYTTTSGGSLLASALYNGEIASTTYTGKVGLMSLSDYAYGATSTYWSSGLDTNFANRILNDWMYNGGYPEWTIAQYNTSNAWTVFFPGHPASRNLLNGYAVRPVLYLNSDVYFSSGTGEKTTPYRITIS